MNETIDFKYECEDGFVVEYEINPLIAHLKKESNYESEEFINEIAEIDKLINTAQEQIDKLNQQIDRLTNSADGIDYMIAVSSGIISGLVDAFFVGELGLFENAGDEAIEKFRAAKGSTNKDINKFIEKYAKMKGYEGEGRLKGAIEFLEKKYSVAQDNIWKGKGISSSKTHHLDDLAHHPTILGLFSAILVQFGRISVFANREGEIDFLFVPAVPASKDELIQIVVPVFLSGMIKWLVNLAEQTELLVYDENIPKPIQILIKNLHKTPVVISVLKVADNWFGHLVSDMGGSKNTAGGGTGITGIFLSFLKEVSMLPEIKNSSLPKLVNDLYQNNKNSPLTDKLDLRTEIAVVKEQMLPMIVNETLVRTVYFVRHLIEEIKSVKSLGKINWEKVIPFGNRTMARMMTVSLGSFMAVDLTDAAIRGAIEASKAGAAGAGVGSAGGFIGAGAGAASASTVAFWKTFVMHINFVGMGRMAVAVTVDAGMGAEREKLRSQRIALYSQILQLTSAKLFYKDAEMWISAEDAEKTINEAYEMIEKVEKAYLEEVDEIRSSIKAIETIADKAEEKNPGLKNSMLDTLKWGI